MTTSWPPIQYHTVEMDPVSYWIYISLLPAPTSRVWRDIFAFASRERYVSNGWPDTVNRPPHPFGRRWWQWGSELYQQTCVTLSSRTPYSLATFIPRQIIKLYLSHLVLSELYGFLFHLILFISIAFLQYHHSDVLLMMILESQFLGTYSDRLNNHHIL